MRTPNRSATRRGLVSTLAIALALGLPVLLSACPTDAGGEGAHGHRHEEEGHADHGDESEHEEDEGRVRLTKKQLASSGIRTVQAAPGRVEEVLELTATVEDNLDAQAHVNPRVSGIVKSIHKRLGDRVEVGDPLCEIDSNELGSAVAAYLEAHALVELGKELLAAEAGLLDQGVEIARRIFEREKQLAEKEISTLRPYYEAEKTLSDAQLQKQRRFLELETELKRRTIQRRAAHARLEALGLTEVRIGELTKSLAAGEPEPPELHGHYTIASPLAGVIVARHVTVSEFVDEEETLFRIHDLRRAWVVASVYERDLSRVRTGQTARVRLNAFPGLALEGKVALVGFELETQSRAVPVRIELPNEPLEAWPERNPIRSGMFGKVELVVGERAASIALPEAAIVHEGPETYVFVREDELVFERRKVRIREAAHGLVEVLSGIEAGEEVVVEGTFALKSAARSEELGGGHSH